MIYVFQLQVKIRSGMFEDLTSLSFFANPTRAKELFLELAQEDPIAQEKLEGALPILLKELHESPAPDMALANLAHFSQMIISRMTFFSSLKQNPALTQMLITLFGQSQFLSDALIRNPEYFDWFIDSAMLSAAKSRQEMFDELEPMVGLFTTHESRLNALRRFKRREMLRIGLRDLMQKADLETLTQELAYLADACLEMAYQICDKELQKKFGTPIEENDPKQTATFAVIGMGKLGGIELNYSSDIDVIFIYSDEGKTNGPVSISNHEFFTKLAQNMIEAISGLTKEGYLFRLDARLRPEGDSGPLARSLASCENYYFSFGETWERLALIKARYCGGDARLAEDFLKRIDPFIYHKYTGYGEIEDLHQMKRRIDSQIAQKGATYRNVKLGYGGIREIEFSVQLLQLLYGGKHSSLKHLGTLPCLRELTRLHFIAPDEESFLREAYIFLRNVEHKLQIMHAQQLHTFPEAPKELSLLSARMGFKKTGKATLDQLFLDYYKALTQKVHALYTQLFKLPDDKTAPTRERYDWLFEKKPDTTKCENLLKPLGFMNSQKAIENLRLLAKGPSYMNLPPRVEKLFMELLPSILQAAPHAADPDQALNNLERFVLAQGSRATFYEVLIQNPKVVELLLTLFGGSQFLSDLLLSQPDLLGIVTLPGEIERKKELAQLTLQLEALQQSETDSKKKKLLLKRFKNEEMLRISLRDLLGLISITDFFNEFSDLADAVLKGAMELIVKKEAVDFAIIGLGKCGGRELSYSSDLDLIFVSKAGIEENDQAASHILNLLNHPDGGGEIFKIDLRLRPDGEKGPLAPSIDRYRQYYQSESATWEKQSLTKARFICGNYELGKQFLELRQQILFTKPISDSEKNEIIRMRERIEKERNKAKVDEKEIKLGAGGIVDVEFIVQFLQLKHGEKIEAFHSQSSLTLLDAFQAEKILSKKDYQILKTGYLFLRTLENKLRIVNNRPLDKLPKDPQELTHCAKRMGYADSEKLLTELEQHTRQVRQVYLTILK